MNTFAIKIAKQAEKLEFKNLSPEIQKTLYDNQKFSPEKDEIYSFKIAIVIAPGKVKRQNALKRDYKLADTIFIWIHDFAGFYLLGITPMKEEHDANITIEKGVDGEVTAGVKLFSAGLKPFGHTKEDIKVEKNSILQSFDEDYAQWLFLKHYLENHLDYKLLLAVRKEETETSKSFTCEVDVQQRGRSLLPRIAKRRVVCVDEL
jgi:hypothetical protein